MALLLLAAPAQAAAQVPEQGEAVFKARCASCHAVAADAPRAAGPNLAGVVGRRLGGDAAYGYSPVFEAARDANEVWDEAKLVAYLADPEDMYPGTWMGNRLPLQADRAAVAAFLAGRPP